MISINKFNSPNFRALIIKPEAEPYHKTIKQPDYGALSAWQVIMRDYKQSDVILGKNFNPEVKLKGPEEITYKGDYKPSILSSGNTLRIHTIVEKNNPSKLSDEIVSIDLPNSDEMNKVYKDMTVYTLPYERAILFADALEKGVLNSKEKTSVQTTVQESNKTEISKSESLEQKSKCPIDIENKSIDLDAFFNMSDEELKNLPNQIKENYDNHHKNIASLKDEDKAEILKRYANFYDQSYDLLRCVHHTLNNKKIPDEMFDLPINMKAQYYTFIDKVSKSDNDEKNKILKRDDNLKDTRSQLFNLWHTTSKEMLNILWNNYKMDCLYVGNRWG